MGVTVGCVYPPMLEQASRDMEAFTVHDCMRGVRMLQVMQPRILHDPGCIVRLDPERVKIVFSQRLISALAGEHPLPGLHFGEAD